MKLIVEAQLPKSLSDFLKYRGHDCIHTLELPKKNNTKYQDIIKFALEEERIVVTKDNDFLESFLLHSRPKKLILVKTGNIPNSLLLNIFADHLDFIELAFSRSNLIEITRTEIVEHE